MNTPNGSNTQTVLNRVLEKISEIANASAGDDYIYRGESKHHCKVCSGLYREYKADIEAERFVDIAVVQAEILKEAKEYTTHKMDDTEILTELQHHGGKTNLIDFTTDYLVALFFACDGNRDKKGRVILLKKQSDNTYEIVPAPRTIPRAGVQKSIFVEAYSGVVVPDIVVCIPVDLKEAMLEYLRKYHDISNKTIYNDLMGFIAKQNNQKESYKEFYKGLTCQEQADSAKNPTEKQAKYDKAIEHYTRAIDLNPEHANAYYNRGITYYKKDAFDNAIKDFNKTINFNPKHANAYYNRGITYIDKGAFDNAIEDFNKTINFNPKHANAYYNRGQAWLHLSKWEKAKADLSDAKDMGNDIVASFRNTYESVSDFEEVYDVQVPKDITAMLSLNGN